MKCGWVHTEAQRHDEFFLGKKDSHGDTVVRRVFEFESVRR